MPTATLTKNGRITIPAALRRQYGWNDGSKGVITPYTDGIMFSIPEAKPKKQALKKSAREWGILEPIDFGGDFLVTVEQWRELANERSL